MFLATLASGCDGREHALTPGGGAGRVGGGAGAGGSTGRGGSAGTVTEDGGAGTGGPATDGPSADMNVGSVDRPDAAPEAGGKALGASCGSPSECSSGNCADGVCCTEACKGQCSACDQTNTKGTCVPIAGTPHQGHTPCAGSAPCGGTCDGKMGDACHYPAADVICTPSSCSNATALVAATCDGHGACGAQMQLPCAPATCQGTICGECSASAPCPANLQCDTGKCVPKLANGKACQRGDQCSSTVCQQNVCCDRLCTGDCESCDQVNRAGTCSPVPAGKVCRAAVGPCDVTDKCDGVATTCPADAKQPASYVCDPTVLGQCDAPNKCDGTSTACPDTKVPNGTPCRAVAGPCDRAEACDGFGNDCPADKFLSSGTVCAAPTTVCSAQSTCDGLKASCPANPPAASTVECRASTRLSDPAELCDGTSLSCPADVVLTNLFQNYEFDQGLASWTVVTTNGPDGVVDMNSAVSGKNSLRFSLQAGQEFRFTQAVSMAATTKYRIGFKGKVDNGTLEVSMGFGAPNVGYFGAGFLLTTQVQQFGPVDLTTFQGGLRDWTITTNMMTADRPVVVWIDKLELYLAP